MRPHACGSGGARGGGEHSSGGSRPSTRPPTKQHKRLADVRAAGANGQPARGRHARQVVLGRQPVRQQNNTKGMRTPAPRAPLGSPPAADTRPGVLQQTRAVWGAGAALPRCPGPRWAARRRGPAHALWCCAHGRGAAACDALLVSAARGVQRAQQGAARALFPILSPILFPIFGKANSRDFSSQKNINNIGWHHPYWRF